jgi:carbon-monoxide dehydrogenase medium subunit
MYPQEFDYFVPKTVDEALSFLSAHENAKVLAGGQSLIPIMKTRVASFDYLVDLSNISDLRYIRKDGSEIHIGAMTTTGDIESSSLIRKDLMVLAETASQIADPQIRNVGTIGGNCSHGDPGNDMPALMLALNARYVIRGKEGRKEIKASNFYKGSFETALNGEEILTEIIVPATPHGTGAAYVKHKRRAGDFSIAAVAAFISLDGSSHCESAGIGMTSVGPTSIKAIEAERYLEGKQLTKDVISKAAEIMVSESDPMEDSYSSSEFKKEILGLVGKEAIAKAFDRASGV